MVFVIDEFPYLARADTSIPSILQKAIDAARSNGGKLFLILCGSSLSFMKEQLLDRQSPLYGRRTAQIELKPFDFFESLPFFANGEADKAAQLFAMGGGVPLYLNQFDINETLERNIERAFLQPSSILYEEPSNLLKQEVSKSARYNSVLDTIASGKSQLNEIATTAHMSTSEASYYLEELQRIGLVEKERPVVNPGRRSIYRISDGLFAFWYRFVYPYRSLIDHGRGEMVAIRIVQEMPGFMGPVFENICKSWLWRMLGRDNLMFTDLGRWWGTDPRTRSQEEIDIVALDGRAVSLVGECKWRSQPTGEDVLKTLDDRAALVGANDKAARLVFSKSEFTESCKDYAQTLQGTRLVTFAEMIESAQ